MRFTFRRDEEGTERIYVGDVCAAVKLQTGAPLFVAICSISGVTDRHFADAIERADEAGFWDSRGDAYYVTTQTWKTAWMHNEVTVEVPITETSTTLTLTLEGDDES